MASKAQKTALLIIDLQQEYTASATPAIPQVLKLHNYFLHRNLLQIFIQDTDTSVPLTSPGFPLIPSIAAAHASTSSSARGQAPLLVKSTRDTFASTILADILRAEAVERVLITGYSTRYCCFETAMSAKKVGWETWLVEDATEADGEGEKGEAIGEWKEDGGLVMRVDDVLRILDEER